jgi:predicted DNA-binding mobile mystery protein A
MKPFKNLQLQTLDQHLAGVSVCDRPSDGWIKAVRKALGMSTRQLAQRMRITQQSAAKLENNEGDDAITLKKLRQAAEAMDCRLVYAFVPNEGSLEAAVRKQAIKKARALVAPVNHTMLLEAQAVGNMDEKIRETAEELMRNITPRLWDK